MRISKRNKYSSMRDTFSSMRYLSLYEITSPLVPRTYRQSA